MKHRKHSGTIMALFLIALAVLIFCFIIPEIGPCAGEWQELEPLPSSTLCDALYGPMVTFTEVDVVIEEYQGGVTLWITPVGGDGTHVYYVRSLERRMK
jgi:hypothetical protein